MGKWRITSKIELAHIKKARRDCPTPILEPEDCIRKAIEASPDAVVSWSGGKCSTIVLHMTLKIKPDIRVIFNDTGVEFPETYAFIKRIVDEWRFQFDVLKPKMNFWACVEKYGFPMLRGKYQPKTRIHGKDGRPMCCRLLKEDPILAAGITHSITGLRAGENRMRMFTIGQRGQYYFAKTLNRWNFHPIAFWTTDQVWQYHEENAIPHNEVYDQGHDRCGCWPCTGYLSWREDLARSHPEMYKALAKKKGEPTLWEYIEDEVELICDKEIPEISAH